MTQSKWHALWVNANLATMVMTKKNPLGVIKNGAIALNQDGTIAWIGEMSALEADPETLCETVYDARGHWLFPGFIDCHTHIVYAGNRASEFEQRLDGVSYAEIAKSGGGILSTVKATRTVDEENLFLATIKRIQNATRHGVTAFEIKSGYGLTTEDEAKMLRVATRVRDEFDIKIQRTFLGAHALPPEYKDNAEAYIDLICDEMMPTLAKENLIDAVDGFCENIGFTREQIQRVFDKAIELKLPLKLHAEQLTNQKAALLAASYDALSADHLEYIDEAGVQMMAEKNTTAVLLPGAFYFLRETQKPPIDLFRKHNVPMAIATDSNPGSAPMTSILLAMNMGCTLFNMTVKEALQGVTLNAAKALGWQESVGSLEIGKRADFALFDIFEPADLVYRIGENPCSGLVLKGQFLSLA